MPFSQPAQARAVSRRTGENVLGHPCDPPAVVNLARGLPVQLHRPRPRCEDAGGKLEGEWTSQRPWLLVVVVVIGSSIDDPVVLHRNARRRVIKIGRFEPTSQVCSQCDVKDGPKPLHINVWKCKGCGAALDGDIDAAATPPRPPDWR
ncbi:zinc ribbon domain-containing protein [Streptomyces sp. NPDC054861]